MPTNVFEQTRTSENTSNENAEIVKKINLVVYQKTGMLLVPRHQNCLIIAHLILTKSDFHFESIERIVLEYPRHEN